MARRSHLWLDPQARPVGPASTKWPQPVFRPGSPAVPRTSSAGRVHRHRSHACPVSAASPPRDPPVSARHAVPEAISGLVSTFEETSSSALAHEAAHQAAAPRIAGGRMTRGWPFGPGGLGNSGGPPAAGWVGPRRSAAGLPVQGAPYGRVARDSPAGCPQ